MRTVVTPTVATDGISLSRMGLSTATPHPEVTRRNRCHMGRRVRVRCPVEIHTRVSKAKAGLLGLIDRYAHLPRLAGFPFPTDHVLEDDPPREHVHCATHLAI